MSQDGASHGSPPLTDFRKHMCFYFLPDDKTILYIWYQHIFFLFEKGVICKSGSHSIMKTNFIIRSKNNP